MQILMVTPSFAVSHKSQLMRNAYVFGKGRGNVSKVLPVSNPGMDHKALLMCS